MEIPKNLYIQEETHQKILENNILNEITSLIDKNCSQAYLLRSPLNEKDYFYENEDGELYDQGVVFLQPGYPIVFISLNSDIDALDYYKDQFTQDITSLSDKYEYDKHIGRPRKWKPYIDYKFEKASLNEYHSLKYTNELDKRKTDLLISLIIGSINNIKEISIDAPDTLLDKVKNKIQLFDGDQTKFIYNDISKTKPVRIQGLSGSGKTELLLHKLKEIYIKQNDSKILFTCHNRILARSLKKRIPNFFNFMKVGIQIDWGNLICAHAWGSTLDYTSGAYRYICEQYDLNFYTYSRENTFDKVCKIALKELTETKLEEKGEIFDYVFIDESQDFPKSFFQLVEKITKKQIYIAGDVFQNIFDNIDSLSVEPNFLLKKCYRTDPRTLMIAHGLGLGIFEEKALKTLSLNEWHACGYNVKELPNSNIELSRDPIRRFEDLESETIDSFSMKILNSDIQPQALSSTVFELLTALKNENPTLQPTDIGIIFLDRDASVYGFIESFCIYLSYMLDCKVNNALKTKDSIENSLFVSNINNVKGLEFPFVICVTNKIKNEPSYRNSLYMTLSRSFLKTYLIVGTIDTELLNRIQRNIKSILDKRVMVVNMLQNQTSPPTINITETAQVDSLYDFISDSIKGYNLSDPDKERIFASISNFYKKQNSYQKSEVIDLIEMLVNKV
jgi:superfamily I DNA and RNA helicase